jgi:glycosyltransferase involved in cell wall biosynthesis
VVVARSHGLEQIAHRAVLDAHARGELHLSRHYPVYHGGIRLWQVSRTLRSADAVLFLNTEEREYAIENLRVRRAGTRIVQNGIPSELLNLPWRETPSPDAPIGVALVGSYSWRKGAPIAVAVLSQTLRTEPRLEATWLGSGASADEVRRSFPSDVRDRLTVVPGYDRRALAPLLRDSHLLLFPSRSEGFSLALVEAMACGLAPVASDIGGAHDLLSGGSAGVLVSPGDASGFASTLDRLIHDRNLLDSMRRSASDLAQSYSWNAVARTLAMSYQDLLNEKASQREAVAP